MSMTDIEIKAFKAYPPVVMDDYADNLAGRTEFKITQTHVNTLREGYIKCAEEYESLPKIHGWVARDKDGSVRLFEKKPEWTHNRWEGHHFYLGGKKFGIDVKRAEPVEVELLIRKV